MCRLASVFLVCLVASGCGDSGGRIDSGARADSSVDARTPDATMDDGALDSATVEGGTDTSVMDAEVDPGTLLGEAWITYYYKAVEDDYPGAADTTLYDASCNPIADVSADFSDAICIEGSGRLSDGRVLNYDSTCDCGRPCPTGGIICYVELDPTLYPWGLGNRGNALEPLRSWATDRGFIESGTVIYSPEWDGVRIPDVDGIGDYEHDGCFRADDVGGAIDGNHVDVFAGTRAMWRALETILATRSNITVYTDSPRCAHLR